MEVLECPTPNVSYSLSLPARERREAALVLDRLEPVAPAGEHLVRIRLVADVPDQSIARRVVDVVQRDGQLDRAETGREMAAHLADGLDEKLAQFVRQRFELRRGKTPQVCRRVDGREQRILVGEGH